MVKALDDEAFKKYTKTKDKETGETVKGKLSSNEIEAIGLPLDVKLPPWLDPIIDYESIISDNIKGFPYESIGIQRMNKEINYTNIVKI